MTTMSRSVFYMAKSGVAVKMNEPVFSSPPLNGILPDILYLQNLPSMVVSHVLNPQPGETILDMCASPGGKSTHIAQLMKDDGTIHSIDKNEGKADIIQKLCNQLGITCVKVHALDSTKLLNAQKDLYSKEDIKFEAGSFDRILLDPPCSGLGQRPRIREDMNLASLLSYAPYQRKLMHTAVQLLKEGGTLVYSTCTLNPQENEELVRFALDNFPLRLERAEPYLGSPGLVWKKKSEEEINQILGNGKETLGERRGKKQKKSLDVNIGVGLSVEEASKVQRFDPSLDGTIGFFVAKFVKTKENTS
eukprot:TRINITY_DN2141_c0_g2_i1.p1 TRINITY_DN2141_c0_g2~~TRINITY_DN2141_c0_g2_i1.p1  ORF type:complete len:305 (-),score=72.06 TRINITY_DN2141_c0_g2_i1:3-917(-)